VSPDFVPSYISATYTNVLYVMTWEQVLGHGVDDL
jgi:hypothetical protein